MKDNLTASLYKASALTFEELGFLLIMPESEQPVAARDPAATASVDFRGTISGRLIVAAYDGLLETLTANMLGEDEGASREQQWDALGEVANVICGNVLPLLVGSKEVFQIDAPRVSRDQSADNPTARVVIPLEQGHAEVSILFDQNLKKGQYTRRIARDP